MPTSLSICSNALILIGDSPITSFTGPGAGAQAANALWTDTYRASLAEHAWTFAREEVYLSRLSATPDNKTGYQYAFQTPPGYIRLWAQMPYGTYKLVGPLLYSNFDSILARYIYEVDVDRLPSHFIKALEYRLASDFAMPVTQNITNAEFYEKKFGVQLGRARTIDSQSEPQEPIGHQPFTEVR